MRVYLTNGSLINSSAISISLFAIVMTSVLTGTALPFGLAKLGVDPANAGTSIQVSSLCLHQSLEINEEKYQVLLWFCYNASLILADIRFEIYSYSSDIRYSN